jgi:hypothetical protein
VTRRSATAKATDAFLRDQCADLPAEEIEKLRTLGEQVRRDAPNRA